jgi:hypothetical protein
MNLSRIASLVILVVLAGVGRADDWREKLKTELPVLGHRNWIVVADAAYPAQSRPGIETLYVGGDQIEILREVLKAVQATKHLRVNVFGDAELSSVPEDDAPGIGAYRKKLDAVLQDRPVRTLPHEDVIAKLDDAAKTFRVLILKTDLTLPYTSVFLELDCGYWNADAEKRLREAIRRKAK